MTVAVGKDGDTAVEGTDYTTVGALTVTISAGDASGYVDFTLSPTDDSLDEDDETLSITGTAEGLTVNAASVSIDDDDDPPTVSVTGGSATEGTAVSFTVSLDAASGRDVKVKWATADHTAGSHKATADSDYTAQTATEITFAAGSTSTMVTVATTADVIDEAAETFLVQLSDATNANISGTAGSATGTISDDDATPTGITLSVDADTSVDDTQTGVSEDGGAKTARITATVDGDTTFSSATTVTVQVGANTDSATEGTDYATVGALTVTIPAGQASASVDFSLSPSDDSRAEGAETISITGSAEGLTVADTSVTIEDDDTTPTAIVLSVDADTETVGTQTSVAEDGGQKTAKVTATVVGSSTFNSDTTVTVAVGKNTDTATEGTDYATVGDLTVTISAGQSSAYVDFELTPTNDRLDEDTESLSISGSSSGSVTFTDTSVDISDDDSPPTVSISDATATEGTAVEFTVRLDAVSGLDVKVKWQTVTDSSPGAVQATADTDYTAQTATEITISAGATSTTVTVDTADDVIDEENETFKVQLSDATNAAISGTAGEATGTITDNDGAPSSITLSVDADTATAGTQSSVAEDGGAKTARITATVDGSTRFNADTTVTVAVGKDGDTAVEGTDYTTVGALTVTISAGDASASVDFTLTPTDDALDEDDETLSITGTAEAFDSERCVCVYRRR